MCKLTKLKDKRNPADENNFNIKYIAESGRTAVIRMMENKKAVENREKSSQIFQHHEMRGHRFNFRQCIILATENRVHPRKFIETAHIKFSESSINRFVDIPSFYYRI